MNYIALLFLSCWVEIPETTHTYCFEGYGYIMSFEFCGEREKVWRSE